MAEPQLLFSEIPLTRAAFDRWLKSTPPSAPHWAEWQNTGFWVNNEQHSVSQALLPFFLGAPDMQRCLLLHDKDHHMLRCALWLRYEEQRDTLMRLVALLRSVAPFMAAKTQARVYHGENVSGMLTLSRQGTHWTNECPDLTPPAWVTAWLESPAEEETENQIDGKLFNQLKRIYNHYLLHATPQQRIPIKKTLYYLSDGSHVVNFDGARVPGANPLTFKRICNTAMSEIYTDGSGVWIDCFLTGLERHLIAGGLRPDQIQIWHDDCDAPFLLRTHDKVWFVVRNERESRFELHSQNIDPATFHQLTWCDFADKDRFYLLDGGNGGLSVITSVNHRNLKRFDERFLLDGKRVLHQGKPLANADAKSFRSLGGGYYADARHVWYQTTLKTRVNPATFRLLDAGSGLAVDDSHVFMKASDFPDADPRSVDIVAPGALFFWRDKNAVWYGFDKLKGSDAVRQQPVVHYPGSLYCRIGNRIWCQQNEIVNADADSFTVTGWNEACDKNGRWYFDRKAE